MGCTASSPRIPSSVRLAAKLGVRLHDVRKPPDALPVGAGRVRELDQTIVLAVGTDANIGKMTVMLQLRDALTARGVRAAFAPTGQTGIFIEGWGICVDAVIADFIAGAAEDVTIRAARDADVVLVEGQGSILHPGYSGVSLGLAARQPAARAHRVSPAEPRDVPAQLVAADPAACHRHRAARIDGQSAAADEDDRRFAEHVGSQRSRRAGRDRPDEGGDRTAGRGSGARRPGASRRRGARIRSREESRRQRSGCYAVSASSANVASQCSPA